MGSGPHGAAISERVQAGRVPPTPSNLTGGHTGKENRMPRTEFYCFHVTGAPKMLFSVQSRSGVRAGEIISWNQTLNPGGLVPGF